MASAGGLGVEVFFVAVAVLLVAAVALSVLARRRGNKRNRSRARPDGRNDGRNDGRSDGGPLYAVDSADGFAGGGRKTRDPDDTDRDRDHSSDSDSDGGGDGGGD